MKTLLEISDLSLFYQTKTAEIKAVDNLSLTVSSGEFVAIIGRSGCGKTSILSVIAGLLPYEGKVSVSGRDNFVKAEVMPTREYKKISTKKRGYGKSPESAY